MSDQLPFSMKVPGWITERLFDKANEKAREWAKLFACYMHIKMQAGKRIVNPAHPIKQAIHQMVR